MDFEKILEAAASSPELNDTYAFKLPREMKEKFFAICSEHDLSNGKVARQLFQQFIEAFEGGQE